MTRNGRFFVVPQKTEENFKQLFSRLAAAGAGRPVDKDGFADGPWTPETLADEISAIDGNIAGIELRSVQVWFQDNDNGISDTNIRWLARVFGCGDPEATSQWQAELKAAKEKLASQRRERKRKRDNFNDKGGVSVATSLTAIQETDPVSVVTQAVSEKQALPKVKTFAAKCERMLSGATSLNLQFGYWLVFCGLGYIGVPPPGGPV